MRNKELPEELKLQIFSRLPAKSVGRCRCLSKRWQDLLSQPDFIKTHLNLSKDRYEHHGLILTSSTSSAVFSASLSNARQVFDEITVSASRLHLPDYPNPCKWVSNCCDGLVLVRDSDDDLFVVNPTTRETRKLPAWPNACQFRNYCEYTKYGFGYDSVRDDYKVVVHVPLIESQNEDDHSETNDDDIPVPETSLYVYSLRTGAWKTLSFHDFVAHSPGGVYLNGHVHWLALWKGNESSIVAFDLENEIPQKCSLPVCGSYDYISPGCRLAVTSGALEIDNEVNCRWVMTKYGVEESWTNFSIGFVEPEVKHLCASGKGGTVVLIDEELYMHVINPGSGESKLKEIVVHGIRGDYYTRGNYAETLVSPNNISAEGKD